MRAGDAYTLRTYERRDAAQVWALHFEGIEEVFGSRMEDERDADVRNVPEVYLSRGAHFWVLESSVRQLVAMLAVKRIDDDTAEIKRLRVRRDLRRTGLAQWLVDAAEVFCRDHGYTRIVLDTTSLQAPAQRLWEKNGFQCTGEQPAGEFTLFFYEKGLR